MSLKAFHIFFVFVTVLMSGVVGAWAWRQYQTKPETTYLSLAIGGGVFAVLFLAYGVWFLKKLRDLDQP